MSNFKARPTTYKGIKMRSRLEAGFAMWLDRERFSWEYEPCAFASEKGQYLPDFRLNSVRCAWLDQPATVYVETKPTNWPWSMDDVVDPDADHERLMRSMAVIWETEPDAVLLLAEPNVEGDLHALATVGILDISISPSTLNPFPWPVEGAWCFGPGDTTGLCKPWSRRRGPWPKDWWKVTDGT